MNKNKPLPNQASAKEKAEGSKKPEEKLPGKTDSGPEPDVFGREIPPQDE